MSSQEYTNTNSSPSFQKRGGGFSRLIVPLVLFFVLLAVNVYFWSDYLSRKNKAALTQRETRTLLSDTVEDQKNSLEENQTKLAKFEEENSALTGELASTTTKLQSIEMEILKYETELSLSASTTELEMSKNSTLARDLTPIKNALLPL